MVTVRKGRPALEARAHLLARQMPDHAGLGGQASQDAGQEGRMLLQDFIAGGVGRQVAALGDGKAGACKFIANRSHRRIALAAVRH
jgi:hypothetical protein